MFDFGRIETVNILKVEVSAVGKKESLAWIEKWTKKRAKKMIVTPNPEQVVMAQKDGSFRKILNEASLALADGVGLVWASNILDSRGKKIEERVTGEEVMNELLEKALINGYKVMFMGGGPGVAEKAAENIRSQKPETRSQNRSFKIKGFQGVADVRRETAEEGKRIVGEINKFKPDLLFVAFGAPWQEKWLARNLGELDVGVAMVVGGALDMIVDPTLKPPAVMTRLGLDWFYRLVRQPWRVRRQLALVQFAVLVLASRFRSV